MRKILIFGNSGSGKSTLAKQICEAEGLPHLDLDTLAWLPSQPPQRRSLAESSAVIEEFIAASDGWVIEGCYGDLLELVLDNANEIIFLNLPVEDCIDNAKGRPWEPHKYPSKAAQDANLEMLIGWIAEYPHRQDVLSLSAHESLFGRFPGKKTVYTTNQRDR